MVETEVAGDSAREIAKTVLVEVATTGHDRHE